MDVTTNNQIFETTENASERRLRTMEAQNTETTTAAGTRTVRTIFYIYVCFI